MRLAFLSSFPIPFRRCQPPRCSRRCTTPIRAVISSEAIQAGAGETELPISVNSVFDDVDISPSSIQTADDIKEIIAMTEEFDLADLKIADHGVEIEITRRGGRGFEDGKLMPPQVVEAPAGEIVEEIAGEEQFVEEGDGDQVEKIIAEEKDPNTIYESDFVVTSNRVGFFFSGAKGKPPLVNVDDKVAFNQPVCIIEQLGQQYVYLSEASGTVQQIFVEDGDAVQYGQRVMVIRPD